jgi:hypothetical protein
MRTPLGPSRTSKSLHRTVSISDTLLVGPRARPSRSPYRPMRSPSAARSCPRVTRRVLSHLPKDPVPPCR